MFIPWDRLVANSVVEVQGTETVGQLRDRLLAMGGRAQHLSALVVHLADGQVVPTVVARIKDLAKTHGRSILHKRLEDLAGELCPQPWEVSDNSPEYRHAELLVQRRHLPVVISAEGQRLGLIRQLRGEITVFRPQDGAFDLFDLSVPDRDRARFVLLPRDADMTAAKQAIAPHREEPLLHLLLDKGAGKYQWTTYRRLRKALTDLIAQETPSEDELWGLSLSRVEGAFEPATVRQIDQVSGTQAEEIARANTLVLTEGGQPASLYPGPTTRSIKESDAELYDPFDDLLPPDMLARTETVVATQNTTIAKIALDLKGLRAPGKAYVILARDDGSCGVIASQSLNEELEKLDTEVWEMPLHRFDAHMAPAPRREQGTVGAKQALALALNHGFIVLTRNGQPIGLLPRQVVIRSGAQDGISAARATGLIFDTPQETLEGHPHEVQPEKEDRFVNLWLADAEHRNLDRREALILRQIYQLKINIGQLRSESLAHGPAIHEPIPKAPRGTSLYVSLFSDDFDIPNPTQPLLLPPEGDSDIVDFEVTPIRRTSGPGDRATLDIYIYYRCSLVQSFRVQAEVVLQGQAAESDTPQEAQLLEHRPEPLVDRIGGFTTLEEIGPRHLSLIIDKARDGSYQFDFVVAGDEKADEVHLSCRVTLRREDLVHLITKARRQLYSIARSPAYQKDIQVAKPTRDKALSSLALLGRQLYSRLFEIGGPDSSARQVGAWIKDNLPEGSTLQIIDRAHDFVFPWSLVYDEVPWDESGLHESVDLRGFWGWRYKTELLTEQLLDTYRLSGVEIDVAEKLQVGVGLNEEIAWGEDQRSFFDSLGTDSGDRAEYPVFDSSPELTRFLQEGNRHILYLFCHGFTERMVTDIQIQDDLLGEFKAWLRTLDPEERAALRHQEDSIPNVSDSWIKLTFGQVPLTMMEYYASPHWAYTALVFLNMCESAQVLPSLSGGFIPFFIQRGVRGVIGTECPITSTFAHPFSQAFFRRFLRGQAVGHIFWELRREFLEQGNPLGLAYTLYCDANLKLKEAVLES